MFAPTNPEHAALIDKLAAALAELPIGGTLAYGTARQIAGNRDVAGRYRYLLESAREKAEAQLGCIFGCVRSIGVQRIAASHCPAVGLAAIQRVRRTAHRGRKRLDRLNTNSLTESEHKQVVAYRSMLGAIGMMADGNKARTIAAVIDPAQPIPPGSILDMFRK